MKPNLSWEQYKLLRNPEESPFYLSIETEDGVYFFYSHFDGTLSYMKWYLIEEVSDESGS